MSIISKIVKRGFKISKQLNIPQPNKIRQQQAVLRKLLERAMFTEFGKKYNFEKIVLAARDLEAKFRKEVPVHNYNDIKYWWERARAGERNVSWPGRIKYFALSSGTSDQGTKYIPVSTAMLRSMKRAGARQFLSVSRAQKTPLDFVTRHALMLGGSTDLNYDGIAFSGDLSGITTGRQPFWTRASSKPESYIMAKKTWGEKIDAILEAAPNWDVGSVAAVPAWMQIIFEKIIAKHKLNTIHDIWPNLTAFIYGGVSITPYRKSMERLFGKPVLFFETYLASEGFFAFQNKPNSRGMRLFLNNGVYFEFVPFNKENFDENYELKPDAKVLTLSEVKVGEEYALLISTVAGTWRYLIGDTIRFVSLKHYEIIITGRTKHFLSLCGEHLSIDNMSMAVDMLSGEFGTEINEYTVIGAPYEGLFCHEWFIGTDKELNPEIVRQSLDKNLVSLNDDYAVERKHGLKEVFVTLLPNSYFNEFLKLRGKEGGQIKFPRVLKGKIVEEWYEFLKSKKVEHARQLISQPQLH